MNKDDRSPAGQEKNSQRIRDHFEHEAVKYSASSQKGLWNFIRQREARIIMEQLAPRPGERILDAGCGAGYYSELLLKAGAKVEAVDFSRHMVAQVRDRLGIQARVCDLMEEQFSPSFDKVLCAGALEFVPDPAIALRNMRSALRDEAGGRMVLHLPRKSFAGRIYRHFHKQNGFHVHLFDKDAIHSMADRAGALAIDTITPVTFNFVVSVYTG